MLICHFKTHAADARDQSEDRPRNRHQSTADAPCSGRRGDRMKRRLPPLADIVAKVFLGWRTKILRAADALYARQLEGPYRFIQNRSRASAVALKSDAAAEKSKDQLSRDFPGRSIFDFCNNIGTFETCRRPLRMSVYRGRPEVVGAPSE